MAGPQPSRRDLIVDVARAGFTTNGYDGTAIGDIATELDISKAAIAYYFPTKETFLDELVAPLLDRLEQAVEHDELRPALDAYLAALEAEHDVAVWVDTDPVIQNHPVHGARLARINDRLLRLVTGGSRRKADRIRALAVLGGVWRPAREVSAADLRSHHEEILDAALSVR